MVVLLVRRDEFVIGLLNLKQEITMMAKVVRKLERHEQLYTFIKLHKEKRAQRVMRHPDLTLRCHSDVINDRLKQLMLQKGYFAHNL